MGELFLIYPSPFLKLTPMCEGRHPGVLLKTMAYRLRGNDGIK